ncbi:MAG: phosphoribosylformylglycinamidine synthase, partial [Proteobacteria bacterium]
ITQKRVTDFMADACPRGLVAAATDNGAGGLASSVGELAQLTGGARIDLALVPLKTPGLQPWEILVSESQERMTLGVRPAYLDELLRIATLHEVEVTVLGTFDTAGSFRACHGPLAVCELELEFLHHGWPRLHLEATVSVPPLRAWVTPTERASESVGRILLELLRAPNVSSRERVVRRYDHEVQARTVVKPYQGRAPQDAAVLRVGRTDDDASGLAVASGICPQYGDLDPYEASACAFDEAIRGLVAVGVHLPFGERVGDFVCACDNFCVPNIRFDAVTNPDGREKLGKLVRMAEATFDVATTYRVPLVSGKDSMKNDFVSGGRTISVPPTVLYTAVGKLRDSRTAVTAEVKADGDCVYLLEASAERASDRALGGAGLGASELARLWRVPELADRGVEHGGRHRNGATAGHEVVLHAVLAG